MDENTEKMLISRAQKARERAYAPYSGFSVGAALLAKDGGVFEGCNIENASYTPTVCAERTAFFKAISAGTRAFAAIAIVGGPKDEKRGKLCPPCGVCRQVMREFCDPDTFRVILAADEEHYRTVLLKDLLPMSFGPEDLDTSYSEEGNDKK